MSGISLTETSQNKPAPSQKAVEQLRDILTKNDGVEDLNVTDVSSTAPVEVENSSPAEQEVVNTTPAVPEGRDEVDAPVLSSYVPDGSPSDDPFGGLDIDSRTIGLLVNNGIPDETTLRQKVADGYDLTEIKGIGPAKRGEIVAALNGGE